MYSSVIISLSAALLSTCIITTAKQIPVYPLPSYVPKACSLKDPNHDKCIVEVGQVALKGAIKGDPKYKIPELDPLLIKELIINQGTKAVGMKLVCTNNLLHGLKNAVFEKSKIMTEALPSPFPQYFEFWTQYCTKLNEQCRTITQNTIMNHIRLELLLQD